MAVNGWVFRGCTHQLSLLANSTTLCPGRAPTTRPAIGVSLSELPSAASGTVLNSIDAVATEDPMRHPTARNHTAAVMSARLRGTFSRLIVGTICKGEGHLPLKAQAQLPLSWRVGSCVDGFAEVGARKIGHPIGGVGAGGNR